MNEGGDPVTLQSPVRPEPIETHPSPTIRVSPTPAAAAEEVEAPPVFELKKFSAYYGSFQALRDLDMAVAPNRITALIGPSGSGKSTVLRWLNRMNDLVPGARMGGEVLYHGVNLFDKRVDPVEVRRRIGMVFQKPNPFPKSIYENVAFGPRVAGFKGKMDEPCSALDPVATLRIEELMWELKQNYTIVIVTHNMQQAARASDETVFLTMGEDRAGYLVERGPTAQIFTNPRNRLTEDYVSGRFG
jgi:phosphate transport system ATP-binding protein